MGFAAFVGWKKFLNLESNTSVKYIPKSSMVNMIVEQLKINLPKNFCDQGGFFSVCFDVAPEICLEEATQDVSSCVQKVQSSMLDLDQEIRCESREDCSRKGGEIGEDIGSRSGSCAGEQFAVRHCKNLKKIECSKYFKGLGIPFDLNTLSENCK